MSPLTRISPHLKPLRPLQGFLRRRIDRLLQGLTEGGLEVHDADGIRCFGEAGRRTELRARVVVEDPSLYTDLARSGALGAGEAYVAGAWSTDDLVAALRILVRNRPVLAGLDSGVSRVVRAVMRPFLVSQGDDRRRSRKHIAAHYDLGNDFFKLWLDPTMTYSCALFREPGMDLGAAQGAKLDQICQRLRLTPGMRVLEIGCGWGGFAIHAAANYGVRVKGTTISRAQAEEARLRVRAAGLDDRIEIIEQDYRDLQGTYDRVVSVEMVEAVGHEHLGRYLQVIEDRLTPNGEALVQAITIAEQHYERARKHPDFIKRHVFPGSFIPSVGILARRVADTRALRVLGIEDYGPHYALTLEAWRRTFLARQEEARALGYDERFLRLWEYYLAYCEAGYREGSLSLVHLHLGGCRAGLSA